MSFALVVAVMLWSGNAIAGHDGYVEFEELTAESSHNGVELDYAIDRSSWRELRSRSIKPTLAIWSSTGTRNFEYSFSFQLTNRHDSLTIPSSELPSNASTLRVEVLGFDGAFRIEGISAGGHSGSRLDLTIAQSNHHGGGAHGGGAHGGSGHHGGGHQGSNALAEWYLWLDGEQTGPFTTRRVTRMIRRGNAGPDTWVWHADLGEWYELGSVSTFSGHFAEAPPPLGGQWDVATVIDACGQALSSSSAETECLDLAINAAFDPTGFILECESAMEGDSNELACIRQASAALADPTLTIRACEEAMEGDANELSCIEAAKNARYDISNTIRACEQAMEGDANELSCIEVTSRARSDMSRSVRACEEAMNGDSSELACVERVVL